MIPGKQTNPRHLISRDDEESNSGIGFLDHLEELRWRLIKIIVAVIIAGGVSLIFGEQIFKFAIRPLGELKLHVTTITGSFYSYLTVSLFAGMFLVLPIIFHQVWSFIVPGLHKSETRVILPALFISTTLFLIGAAFCFEIVLPYTIAYLVSFSGGALAPIITVDSYLSFAGMMTLAFGAGFNMPVLAYFLAKLGLIRAETLSAGRRVAIVLILIFGAIITPPDVFTQLMLGGPLYILYEISIFVVRLTNPPDPEFKS